MKKMLRKGTVFMLSVVMAFTVCSVPVSALETAAGDQTRDELQQLGGAEFESEGSTAEQTQQEENEDLTVSEEEGDADALTAGTGDTITGSFEVKSGKDIATIRYYTDKSKTRYAFAEFVKNGSAYEYSFDAPYDGFTAVQGTSKSDANATVIAEYYSTTKWDGAVDVSWYDGSSSSFEIGTPAQLAGLAAIVNGSINSSTPIYRVKGDRSDVTKTFDYDVPQTSKHQDINEGLPDRIENTYYEKTDLIAGVEDEAYEGLAKHDFSNCTVNITADMDMGGTDPANIDHSKNETKNAYDGTYPNWTPIGGEYLMDPSDGATMIKASFNGTLNGNGHAIKNLYCYRWSYRSVGDTAFGYAQGTGLIGMMGSLYDGESEPSVMPGVRNMSLSGYIYGRRMVGGFVGCMGGGSNAASGTSVDGGITLENLANHAEVHCTDSKGLGGIVACSMIDRGSIINCYNTGYMDANYAAPTGGIIGSNEGMSIYCCYNTGTLYTHGNSRGRGIGCNNSGANYKVDDCYYLEGCGDDEKYPGYYTYNLAKSVMVTTTAMSNKDMKNGTLLEKLNVNGTAYVKGSDGLPVLYWEKHSSLGTGTLNIEQNESAGTINATKSGSMKNGTIVYLSSEVNAGWKLRNYRLNGNKLSGNYVTVNGTGTISGNFEEVKPGTIKIKSSDVCDVAVTKNGIIKKDGETITVEQYPVKTGDTIYEGDQIMVTTTLKSNVAPEDEDLMYKASAPDFFSTAYEYTYSYINEEEEVVQTETTEVENFKVGSAINEDGISLVLNIKALTSQKMWDHVADTSWYNQSQSTFTINHARQLAGLSVLVDRGTDFQGKTVKLGKDISLANDDGTSGKRYWDGIGDSQGSTRPFAGTFDGNGHKITEYNGSSNALFEYCAGRGSSNRAVIKDVALYGASKGQDACSIVMKAQNTEVEDCTSYCTVEGTANGHSASMLGYANGNCTVKNCINYANIEGCDYVGGIVGEMNATSTIESCVNKGNVYSLNAGGNNIGGIVGSLYGKIYDSANYGNIMAYGRNIGGVTGQSVSAGSLIESCCNVGRVTYKDGTSTYDSIGGIIGYGSIFNIRNAYNYGVVETIRGKIPKSNTGAVVGRDLGNSKSKTEDVYYLDGCCDYVRAGMTEADIAAYLRELQEEDQNETLPDYCIGIKKATASEFASSSKVLASINERSTFKLTNRKYPEVARASGTHIHRGGSATCTTLAVCEECGLRYGLFSEKHGDTKVVGAKDVVWLTSGYTGDTCCKDCGEILEQGTVIEPDPDRLAMTVYVKAGKNINATTEYSVKQFDDLKVTGIPIGYSYGSKSTEIVAATKYVTLEKLLEEQGLTLDEISSIDVACTGVTDNINHDTLTSCNKYYEDGKEYDAPAAFAIEWNTDSGKLATVAEESKIGGTIRFGYGISQKQYKENAAVGGRRIISPVVSLTINLAQPKVDYNGTECYLSDALDRANENGGTITLTGNLDTGSNGFVLNASSNTVKLNLAGHELSSNAENVILVKSGKLEIEGEGTIDGNLVTKGTGVISASGGSYTYQLEEEYCAEGYVPEYNKTAKLYVLKKKSALQATQDANLLAAQLAKLNRTLDKLEKKLALLDTAVTISAASTAYNSVTLSWDADKAVDTYLLEKKVGGEWVKLDIHGSSHVDGGEPGIKNEYRLAAGLACEAEDGAVEYVYGKHITASATPALGKAAISSITTKSKKITVKWKAVAGATGYDVQYATNSAMSKNLVKYTNVSGLSKKSKTLKKGKKYYVKVRARVKNSAGQTVYGPWSSAKAIKCK